MNSDTVNSLSDTIESISCAEVIRQVYYEIVDEYNIPATKKLVALEGLADLTKPNYMRLPEDVSSLEWVKYDARVSNTLAKHYSPVQWLEPESFLCHVNARASTETDRYQIVQYDLNIPLIIDKLHHPQYWTSFDDEYIIFDGYNSVVESTLQSSKCIAFAEFGQSFSIQDDYIPELPNNLANLLYLRSLNRMFANRKGMVNPKTEQAERRMNIRAQRHKWRSNRLNFHRDGPDYSR